MNIFFLDKDPAKAAKLMIDVHTNKMITETAQILSNCYPLERLAQSDCPRNSKGGARKHSYPHHPCCKWVQESIANFNWLVKHGFSLYAEKIHRMGGDHFSIGFIEWCATVRPDLPQVPMTPPVLAFNGCDQFKDHKDPVTSYRRFYAFDKKYNKAGKRMDNYTKREKPDFWVDFARI